MEWNGVELNYLHIQCNYVFVLDFLKASFYGKLAAKYKRNKDMF